MSKHARSYWQKEQEQAKQRQIAKVGDRVFIETAGGLHLYPQYQETKIERLTKRWIITTGEMRFRKNDGRRVGDDHYSYGYKIVIPTPSTLEEIEQMREQTYRVKRKRYIIRAIRDNISNFSNETLEKIVTVVKENEEGREQWLDPA